MAIWILALFVECLFARMSFVNRSSNKNYRGRE